MQFFGRKLASYSDSTLGWRISSWEEQNKLLSQYMPKGGEGRFHPLRILGGPNSVVVLFNDTPELFGGEIHAIGAVGVRDGKLVRWADYRNSVAFGAYAATAAPDEHYPAEFGEGQVGESASPAMLRTASKLHAALVQGDAAQAASMFSYDACIRMHHDRAC